MPVPDEGEVGGTVPNASEADAPLVSVRPVDEMVVEPMENPPIVPLVAVMEPEMMAPVARKTPAIVTEKGAVANVPLPRYRPWFVTLKAFEPAPDERGTVSCDKAVLIIP
jgi:hypothetical protein